MKYVAAYLLANLGGKSDPSVKDLSDILGSVGVEVEQQQAETVVKLLNGKNIEEVIAAGQSKLATVPSGGAAPAAAAPAGGAAPAADKPAAKKEEKKEESEDEDMGFGLFD
ncbi:unnamed protein product [Bursaphelenchus okinawaensis]|uniref:Large ribosomal subunit protein P2 n=1 Tax=Bursaphelenchus okinawaensis TaxID=465554 RepID=A0A811JTZ6_9BILA|nr:unnamed protein product [Bursaphelenchus okinawaensis]CAG9083719.1 unnamed protein product [Bursaphelenchus okinawaensis]